jgi:hypothetical protein
VVLLLLKEVVVVVLGLVAVVVTRHLDPEVLEGLVVQREVETP